MALLPLGELRKIAEEVVLANGELPQSVDDLASFFDYYQRIIAAPIEAQAAIIEKAQRLLSVVEPAPVDRDDYDAIMGF